MFRIGDRFIHPEYNYIYMEIDDIDDIFFSFKVENGTGIRIRSMGYTNDSIIKMSIQQKFQYQPYRERILKIITKN